MTVNVTVAPPPVAVAFHTGVLPAHGLVTFSYTVPFV
jgi:hypothetical protein